MTDNRKTADCHLSLPRSNRSLCDPLHIRQGVWDHTSPIPIEVWWDTVHKGEQIGEQDVPFFVDQALWWCNYLGRNHLCRGVRYRAISRDKSKPVIKGNLADLDDHCRAFKSFAALQAQGYGIYAVVNKGGDTKDSITECVALFAEWDDLPIAEQMVKAEQLGLPQPSFKVITGGKSVHCYWRLRTPITRERWEPLMKRLIQLCGSDKCICDASRVMRLPGSWYIGHDLKVGPVCHIRDVTNHSYEAEDFEKLLPVVPRPVHRTGKYQTNNYAIHSLQEIADALSFIPSRVPGLGNYPKERNMAWGLKAAVFEAGYGIDVAKDLLEEHSPSDSSGWKVDQILNSGGDQINAATFWWHAMQHGYRKQSNG